MKHAIIEHSPTHFECRHCRRIWQTYPDPHKGPIPRCHGIPVPTRHDLIQHSPDHFECRKCHSIWQTKPRSKCPNMRLFPKYGHEPYLTKLQLGYAGYEIAESLLPQPIGCFQSKPGYVLLYNPEQAVKKRLPAHQRTTVTLTDLFWPLDSIPLIEFYLQRLEEEEEWFTIPRGFELADIAYYFSQFDVSEIKQMGHGYWHFKIAPCLLHPTYLGFQTSPSERAILLKSILAAYQKQKATS
jgi:hypothetical protein